LARIFYLAGIFLVVWSSLIVGMWIIKLIVPLSLPWPGAYGVVGSAVAKVLAGALMAGVWLYMWKLISDRYFSWAIRKRGLQLK